jgi:hypothetical protein
MPFVYWVIAARAAKAPVRKPSLRDEAAYHYVVGGRWIAVKASP